MCTHTDTCTCKQGEYTPVLVYYSPIPIQMVFNGDSYFLIVVDSTCRVVCHSSYADILAKMNNLRNSYEKYFGLAYTEVALSGPTTAKVVDVPVARMKIIKECGKFFVTDGNEFFYRTNVDVCRATGMRGEDGDVQNLLSPPKRTKRKDDDAEMKQRHPGYFGHTQNTIYQGFRRIPVNAPAKAAAPPPRTCAPNCLRCSEPAKYPRAGKESVYARPQDFMHRIESSDWRNSTEAPAASFKRFPLVSEYADAAKSKTPGTRKIAVSSDVPSLVVKETPDHVSNNLHKTERIDEYEDFEAQPGMPDIF